MRVLQKQRDALAYLQDRRAPAHVVKALGDLIDEAESLWRTNSDGIFQGSPGALQTTVNTPPQYTNYNTSFVAPFVTGRTSSQVLPTNPLRTFLLIQNLSAASNLYFNLGSGAGVNSGVLLSAGQGIVFDNTSPSDSINVYYDNATPQQGVVLEMRFTVN